MKFKDIPGQETSKQRLTAMVDSNTLPHALLLQGPPGTYKLALAQALAQYIHCTGRTPNGDSCGHCPACLQHEGFNNIDTVWVYPVVKTEKIKEPTADDYFEIWKEFFSTHPSAPLDEWTAMLDKKNAHPIIYVYEARSIIHKLNLTSHGGGKRVVIVWLPERLNEEAANKLLKIIEEPHPGTHFIMVSDSPKEILPTIYSRAQRIDIPALPDQVIIDVLGQSIDPAEAQAIAHNAEGDVNRALSAVNITGESKKMLDRFIQLMRLAYMRNVSQLKTWGADLATDGREVEIKFYENAMRLVRENFIYNFNHPELNYLTREEAGFSVKFARFINEVNVEKLIEVFNKALRDIAANANGKIVNFDVALKVCFLIRNQ